MTAYPPAAFTTQPPATLAGGANWNSGVVRTIDAAGVVACCQLTQTGTLTVQRYADVFGTVVVGALISQTLTASTAAWAGANDGLPFNAVVVIVTNTSGSTGTLSGVYMATIAP